MRKGFNKALSFVLSAAMMVSLGSGLDVASVNAANGAKAGIKTAPASTVTYGAIVSFQTSSYAYRNGYEQDTSGFEQVEKDEKFNAWLKANGKEVPSYNAPNIYLNGNGPDLYKRDIPKKGYVKGNLDLDSAAKAEPVYDVAVSDAVMDKDGEYTVSISNLDFGKEEAGKFRMLAVATNIVKDDVNSNVTAVASSIKINDKEIIDKETVLPVKGDIDKGQCYKFMIANAYEPGDHTTPSSLYPHDANKETNPKDDNITTLEAPTGKVKIEITYKLQGVNWSYSPDGPVTTPEPDKSQAPEITPPAEVPLSKPFDMVLSANVNEALTPSAGPGVRENPDPNKKGEMIQSAIFGSEAMKAKVVAAKGADGNAIYNANQMDYIVSDSSCATISKTGEYSLSVTARSSMDDLTAKGAIWFPIIINGSTGEMPKDFNLRATKIIVGEGASAQEYAWTAQLMQDAKGDVRLSVCNQWAQANEKDAANTIKDAISVNKGDKITFKFYVTGDAPAPAKTATPEAIGASTSYMSYLGFQTDDWMYRDPWHADTGLKSKEYNYKKQVAWSHGDAVKAIDVSITDAKMTKNNVKYKVAIDGLNIKKTSKKSTQFNMLYLSTDIPLSMKGVSVKNAVLKIDGKTVKNYKVVPNKGDASKYYQFMLADAYAPSDGTKNAAYPNGKTLKKLPTKSIEVEYTVSGVDFNSRVVSVGNFKYKLTKNKAQVVGLSKKGKKKANLSLGKTIKVKAASPSAISSAPAVQTYKITSVKAGAFKNSSKLKKFSFKKATNIKALPSKAFMNCKKLKTVELNKKMKKIPAQAFKGCKKLTTIKCNAKLKSVSKSAFKGCKKKIKVTGKSKKANKKKIKKAYKKVK